MGYGIQGLVYVKRVEEAPFAATRRELLIVSSVLEEVGIVEHDERVLLDDRITLLQEGVNPGDVDELLMFTSNQREYGSPIRVPYIVKRGSFPFFEHKNSEMYSDFTQVLEIYYNFIGIDPFGRIKDQTWFIIAQADYQARRGDDWYEGMQKKFANNPTLVRLRARLTSALHLVPDQVCTRIVPY